MKHLTLEQINRIGEAFYRNFPPETVVEWKYIIGRKSDSFNFRIKK